MDCRNGLIDITFVELQLHFTNSAFSTKDVIANLMLVSHNRDPLEIKYVSSSMVI